MAAQSSRYVAPPLASALVEPYIIPHRGSSLLYPENTLFNCSFSAFTVS